MNQTPPNAPSESLTRSKFGEPYAFSRSTVSRSAILAGATTALALHVRFMMLGAGLGLAV